MTFTKALLAWYDNHKRNLPWRETKDPYKIWLSEIILQQTRIEQGLSYYNEFTRRFPDILALAKASEQEVLKLWQGLGYYSRARNLHHTASLIAREYNGLFPAKYEELLKLKGIGEYTAAAIASIAFNEPRPVVDGNVLRFLSRHQGIDLPVDSHSVKKKISEIAMNLMDKSKPGDFNQAMMEFGALYCKPKNPGCENCIFKTSCRAYKTGLVNSIPVKAKTITQRKRYFHYLVFLFGDHSFYLHQREGADIWKNLYDFPLIEKDHKIPLKNIINEIRTCFRLHLEDPTDIKISKEFRHILTHQVILARFFIIPFKDKKKFRGINMAENAKWRIINIKTINKYPVPRLIEFFLKEYQFLKK